MAASAACPPGDHPPIPIVELLQNWKGRSILLWAQLVKTTLLSATRCATPLLHLSPTDGPESIVEWHQLTVEPRPVFVMVVWHDTPDPFALLQHDAPHGKPLMRPGLWLGPHSQTPHKITVWWRGRDTPRTDHSNASTTPDGTRTGRTKSCSILRIAVHLCWPVNVIGTGFAIAVP